MGVIYHMVRIDCPSCGRTHTTRKLVKECQEKLERRIESIAKREAEVQRRIEVSQTEPVRDVICRMRGVEGAPWDGANGIIPAIKKNYPKDTPHDIWTVMSIYAE